MIDLLIMQQLFQIKIYLIFSSISSFFYFKIFVFDFSLLFPFLLGSHFFRRWISALTFFSNTIISYEIRYTKHCDRIFCGLNTFHHINAYFYAYLNQNDAKITKNKDKLHDIFAVIKKRVPNGTPIRNVCFFQSAIRFFIINSKIFYQNIP